MCLPSFPLTTALLFVMKYRDYNKKLYRVKKLVASDYYLVNNRESLNMYIRYLF